ncbi:MAG: hypothetical protein ABL999_05410 [Pyrinomonadaceae bacterium]
MGQLIIEVPQDIHLRFRIRSKDIADQILRLARKPKKPETLELELPDLSDINAEDAFGIWSAHEESADEIARKVRENNRKVT